MVVVVADDGTHPCISAGYGVVDILLGPTSLVVLVEASDLSKMADQLLWPNLFIPARVSFSGLFCRRFFSGVIKWIRILSNEFGGVF